MTYSDIEINKNEKSEVNKRVNKPCFRINEQPAK